jgi:hypothetical protein
MWVVAYLPQAEQERAALPKPERAALINADVKLGAYGPARRPSSTREDSSGRCGTLKSDWRRWRKTDAQGI